MQPHTIDNDVTHEACDLTEFNALRAERIKKHQNKMKAIIRLIKNHDETKEDSLIEQIVY